MSLFHKKSFDWKICPRMPAKAAGIVILSKRCFFFLEMLNLAAKPCECLKH